MSIYSDTVQQLTDQLVTDVSNLDTVVTSDPTNMTAISAATDTTSTTANNLDQAIKTTDIPPDGTMILELSTQLLSQITDLNTAISASDSSLVVSTKNDVVETTMNINRCVTRMSENQSPPPTPEATPLPPWLSIPTTPVPDGG